MPRKPLTLLLITLAAATLFGCSSPKDRVVITGEIIGVKHAEFYVYCEDGSNEKVDTIRITNGTFTYERQLTEPAVLTLLYPNFTRTLIVAEPGTEISLEGNAAGLGKAKIIGTEENELLTDFRIETADFPAEKARLAAADFIRSHADKMAAVAVFLRYFAANPAADADMAASLLKELKKAQPESAAVTAIATRTEPLLDCAPGKPLPDFTATTLSGDTVRRADFKGRPCVIMHWAAWSAECNDIPASLRRLETAYGTQLGLLVMSADYSAYEARRRARRDSIRVPIICEQRGIAAPIARKTGMRYVPGNMLIGADGRIIARDLPLYELERKVDELF